MCLTIKGLMGASVAALLTSSAFAQTPATTAPVGRMMAPQSGTATQRAVQPGAGATQVQPGGQPIVPQAGAGTQGPYGGASAVLPQQLSSPTGPTPVAPNAAGNANARGPYGGFAAVGPPRLVAAPMESPSPIFPGAGVPIAPVQPASLIGGAFPGQMALNGVVRALPTVPIRPLNPAVVNPGTANVAQPGALGQVAVPRSGISRAGGPYGGAAAVLPPPPSSPTAVNPVFERFFAGLNAAVTPTAQPTFPTP